MTFCGELKEYLLSVENKKSCCADAFAAGMAGTAPELVCQKDASAYLRGVFIKSGFVSPPEKELLLTLETEEPAKTLLEEAGIAPKTSSRRGKPRLYYKDSNGALDFLSYIGGGRFALRIMQSQVIKELRADANRKNNAETANLDRTAKAAAEQCGAIKRLISEKRFTKLAPELREAAEIRLANPDMSLDELRTLLEKPISKSGLNHRLNRIIEIANGG